MAHISWSSDNALYLNDYLIREMSYLEYCDTKADLKICACQCDLYFMVQRFILIFQRLFDGEISDHKY